MSSANLQIRRLSSQTFSQLVTLCALSVDKHIDKDYDIDDELVTTANTDTLIERCDGDDDTLNKFKMSQYNNTQTSQPLNMKGR